MPVRKPRTPTKPVFSRREGAPKTTDYGLVHDMVMKHGVKKIRDTPALRTLRTELVFFLEHADRRNLGLTFVKCKKPDCACGGWAADWGTGFLKDFEKLGSTMPTPTPSDSLPGHYKTYREHLEAVPGQRARPDLYCPSRIRNKLGWCSDCRAFCFTSKTDKADHQRKVHGAIVRGVPQSDLSLTRLPCPGCDLDFDSKWSLSTHLKRSLHGRTKAKTLPTPVRGRRAAKIGEGRFKKNETRNKHAPVGPAEALPVPAAADRLAAQKRQKRSSPATVSLKKKPAAKPAQKKKTRKRRRSSSDEEDEETSVSYAESEEDEGEEEGASDEEGGGLGSSAEEEMGEPVDEKDGWMVVGILDERWVFDQKQGASRQYDLLFHAYRFKEKEKWRDADVQDEQDMPATVLSAWRVDHAPADVRWVAAKNSNRQAKRKMAEAKKLYVDSLKSNSSSAQRD